MPDDATGDALRRMAEAGSDLTRPMEVDFFLAVPDEAAGRAVGRKVSALGFRVSVERDDESRTWTCYCTKTLVPEYSAVVSIERQLDEIAKELGGYADGFGSFGNSISS